MTASVNFAYAGFFSALMNGVLTVIVCRKAPTRAVARVYFAAGTTISAWCALAASLFVIDSQPVALRTVHVLHVAVLFLPATTLQLTLLVAGIRAPRITALVYGLTVLLLATMPFGAYIHGVERLPHAWYAIAGPGFWAFSALLPAISIPMLTALARRRRVEKVNKRRYTVLMAANGLMIATGAHDCLPVCGFAMYPHTSLLVYPWGTYAATFYGALFAYATLQEHALDVRFDVGALVAAVLRLGIAFGVAFPVLFAVSAFTGLFPPAEFGLAVGILLVATTATMLVVPPLLGAISSSLHAQALTESRDYRAGVVQAADDLLTAASYDEIWDALRQAFRGAMRIERFGWTLLETRRATEEFAGVFPDGATGSAPLIATPAMLAFFETSTQRYFDVAVPADAGSEPLAEAQREARGLGGEFVFATPGPPDVRGVLIVGPKPRGYSALDIELLAHVAQRLGVAAQRIHVMQRAARAERHELLSLMGRGLAHDLQNLVVPVRTFLDVLRRSSHLDEREQTLHAVASDNLSAVRAYLANAVLFGADMQARLTPTSTAAVISGAASAVMPGAAEKSIELRLGPDSYEVVLDPVLAQRLLVNLLGNAIDASPQGAVVEVNTSAATDGRFRFEIRDHGAGIPPDVQRMLFQPYFTTKGSGADGPRGFGLGLALCQRIVELHEGRIWFETTPGGGTTFFVDLPRLPKPRRNPVPPFTV